MYFYPRPPGGGRPAAEAATAKVEKISIHALRVEGDVKACSHVCDGEGFLSTPSGWRATTSSKKRTATKCNFYPRPPGGGRRKSLADAPSDVAISIHALRVEGDGEFTPDSMLELAISIHALRVEGDARAYHGVR